MSQSSALSRVVLVIVAAFALCLGGASAMAQTPTTVVNQTTPYVDPIIPGDIVYRTGDELRSTLSFENTVRVTSITINYTSTIPVNYVVRFYSGSLVRAITIPNLPAGGGVVTYSIPAAEQFDWAPQVTTNFFGTRISSGQWSVQLTRTDGTSSGTLAGHRMADIGGPGFWLNATRNVVESGSSVGIATFDLALDQEAPVGFYIRIDGTLAVPPSLSAITPNPISIRGGSTGSFSVISSAPAPAGGLVVRLASNSSAASVPTSVTIPAGATSATVVVRTTTVRRNTSATITATLGNTSRTANVTVLR
jgi:hypothetical protein